MANEEHLKILRQGVEVWNQWRERNPDIQPSLKGADLRGVNLRKANLRGADLRQADLSGASLWQTNLSGADLSETLLMLTHLKQADLSGASLREADLWNATLSGANLSKANLFEANLSEAHLRRADISRAYLRRADFSGAYLLGADLYEADLSEANLYKADLRGTYLIGAKLYEADLRAANLRGANLFQADLRAANLKGANLRRANLPEADLSEANLYKADLCRANLREADLTRSQLVQTNLNEANLTSCSVFGISAWGLQLSWAIQTNLVITPPDEPTITVDNLEVAQFIYLLLNNERIRDVIDTITSKVVLILGRFTPERKAVLDAIRNELRRHDYLPVLFDFDKPASRDITETVRTLAHLARFIIADLTEPRSIPQELQAIVPGLAVPVQPLLLEGSTGEWGMFQDLRKYDWVLEVHRYDSLEGLLTSLGDRVFAPAEAKAKELEKR